MDDRTVLHHIETLVEEEKELHTRAGADEIDADGRKRLAAITVSLDQCWDYLRQRRAARANGQDPDTAGIRPPEIVERYVQ